MFPVPKRLQQLIYISVLHLIFLVEKFRRIKRPDVPFPIFIRFIIKMRRRILSTLRYFPSRILTHKSTKITKIPATGLIASPEIPCQVPFKNPLTPPFLAPSNGFKNSLTLTPKKLPRYSSLKPLINRLRPLRHSVHKMFRLLRL